MFLSCAVPAKNAVSIWFRRTPPHLGCVCPECFYRCTDCLGTNTVVSRDAIRALAFDPRFQPENLAANFVKKAEDDDEY